jgi:acyl-CoA synthetase (AMP-forming)/AMP-acid ligase II
MQGLMMNYPLTLNHILERAGKLFPDVEIVSRMPDRSLHRYTYKDFYSRTRALANALRQAGLKRGDRVGTLMWNHHAHIESYFGIPAAGGVLHTLNLRLAPADLAYIIRHAGDRFLIVDSTLLPLYEKVKSEIQLDRAIIVSLPGCPEPPRESTYEEFLASGGGEFQYQDFDENEAAAMCYTSGTTGVPKGVVYSHRALVLHSLVGALPDQMAYAQRDVMMPIVPMFHVNAWGMPFGAPIVGCKIVLPGPHMDAENLLDLMEREQVTVTAGVPTVWFNVMNALEKTPERWKLAPDIRVLIGGAAPPESLIRKMDRYGMRVVQGWGLTESTPLATLGNLKAHLLDASENERYRIRAKAGLPSPFCDLRVMSEEGEVPRDGETIGEVQLRGPWVASSYYDLSQETEKWTEDGWFRTGDVGTLDADGYLKLTDRTKDLIKSGGEWISSVDLENAIVAHPDVREAAVIAVAHPKWQERPLALVVLKDGSKTGDADLRAFLESKFAKWQLPDAFVFVNELPHTSTGKLLKRELRKRYQEWKWDM